MVNSGHSGERKMQRPEHRSDVFSNLCSVYALLGGQGYNTGVHFNTLICWKLMHKQSKVKEKHAH